ncbi:hypothetical protein SAMN05216557_102361 [Sphingomonas carotinifaciens]|uniref:DUF475 domain-containing protein n=1 Tax=Sphingomonas carotinifaciens TaxID=1166323 RepID=A0A1G7IS58_9SPHN|nr:hypothetical protein [Sphingomonas carotinifaciens]SDF15503.1 hypothetical protein SAMN05216557_102361 [Sphingomonas carotinifaciens]
MLLKYYKGSFIFTGICLAIAAWLGMQSTGTVGGTLGVLWIVAVLGVLEVSLSFDNAVVNATVLRDMDEKWRRRFLTWGILIAVFGMRIVFPLAIVAIAASLGPVEALKLAAGDPVRYEQIITSAHVGISGFGGAFLAMVGLNFFFDDEKEEHWIGVIERPLAKLTDISGLAVGIVLLAMYVISRFIPVEEAMTYITSGIFGLLTYIAVHALGVLLEGDGDAATGAAARSGLASFLYLEVLDASFSFDGVIGAFALSNNLFIIALGLGIGAMFVRSMTIMLVDKGTLTQYRYLEHGAFYAIIALAAIMLLSVEFEIPETVTGLIGAALIGLAFWASVRSNKRDPEQPIEAADPVKPSGTALKD